MLNQVLTENRQLKSEIAQLKAEKAGVHTKTPSVSSAGTHTPVPTQREPTVTAPPQKRKAEEAPESQGALFEKLMETVQANFDKLHVKIDRIEQRTTALENSFAELRPAAGPIKAKPYQRPPEKTAGTPPNSH